jgi:polysaccharide pyruvyl transferase WcaK-like protein
VLEETPDPEVIYLVSTCSNANFGDEFITAAWLRFLAQQRPDAEVWLDCPQPGVATHLFTGLHPGLRITDVLWRVVWETRDREPDAADAHVDQRMRHLGSPRYDIGLLGARRATTVHLLGGAHINSTWPEHLRLLRAARLLKELSGARLFATGHQFMPLNEADWVRQELAAFDHVTVRDRQSAEATGAEVTSDDAFLGIDRVAGFAERAQTQAEDTDVWVCIQSDVTDPGAFEAAVAAARKFLTGSAVSGRTVRYLEAIPGVDRIGYDELKDLIPEENLVSFRDLWDDGFPGRAGQVWFTSRYHFHLLAAACGAVGTAVEINDDFYRVKHESLLEAGTGWSLVRSGSEAAEAPAGDPQFRVTAARLHRTKVLEAEKLYPRLAPRPSPVAHTVPDRSFGLFRRR